MDDPPLNWIVLLAQLPAAPSSARVALWRRLRAAGAASLANGAWVLPAADEHSALIGQLATTARAQGGQASIFNGHVADGDEGMIERFRADREREYGEFDQRTAAFLAEIDKETGLEKFTFAELEEIEDDFEKLAIWLAKIEARDFFPGEQRTLARKTLEKCERARDQFAETVYGREGLAHPNAEIS